LSPARRRVTAHVRSVRHARVLGHVVLRSALALPFHIALVFLRVSAVLLQGAYSHTGKTHAWSENASKNSKQRREDIISFCTLPSGGRPMLPGNRQNGILRAGFSSKHKAQERV